jgi:(4-O-methyl)-D-glucuronate---lignin esterase
MYGTDARCSLARDACESRKREVCSNFTLDIPDSRLIDSYPTLMNRRSAIRTITGLAAAQALGVPSKLQAQAAQSEPVPLPPSPTLPAALVFRDGTSVRNPQDWERRRAEILATAELQMYGIVPGAHELHFDVREKDAPAFNGLALRTQVRLLFKGTADGPSADLLLYTPRHTGRYTHRSPAILGLNFWGNHTVCSDPGIYLSKSWIESGRNIFADLSCVVDHRATPTCRGIDARRWPIEKMLRRGYAFATMYRGDIDPDVADGSVSGLRSAYPRLADRGDNFSAIAAWAWALSRSMDYLQTDHRIDGRRVAIFGWSRLGKAAVWAGAHDRRFAAVLSNESGAGGAKLFRRDVGEDIHRLTTVFPHWFCRNFRDYNGMDRELPFDQHLILSAIAPRLLYVGSAAEDHLSDPEGEFASAVLASDVYRFLGSRGLDSTVMPKVGQAISGRVSYHIRPGGHDVTDFDWNHYLDFLDKYLRAA